MKTNTALIVLVSVMLCCAGVPLLFLNSFLSNVDEIKGLKSSLIESQNTVSALGKDLLTRENVLKRNQEVIDELKDQFVATKAAKTQAESQVKELNRVLEETIAKSKAEFAKAHGNAGEQNQNGDESAIISPVCLKRDFGAVKYAFDLGSPSVRQFMRKHPIYVLLQYYRAKDPQRDRELQGALQANLANVHIKEVHALLEGNLTMSDFDDFFAIEKLKLHAVGHRMDVSEAMEYANSAFPEGSVVVLINSDIFFDDTVRFFVHMATKARKTSYFVSRKRTFKTVDGRLQYPNEKYKEVTHLRDHCLMYGGSHDAFGFVTPLSDELVAACRFPWGSEGFENRFMYEFMQAGVMVTNPCKVIHAHHMQGDYGIPSGPTPPRIVKRLNIGKSAQARPTTDL